MVDYKDFKKKVYEEYKKSLRAQDQDEVEEYFKSDEAEREIKNGYERLIEQVKAGDITEDVVMGTGAGGVAYCLVMMF